MPTKQETTSTMYVKKMVVATLPPSFYSSLQILLHKNLMRLRQFMAAPDKPIPDAPKDWTPPMPRPDTPSTGDSDSDKDSDDDVRLCVKGRERADIPCDVGVAVTVLLLRYMFAPFLRRGTCQNRLHLLPLKRVPSLCSPQCSVSFDCLRHPLSPDTRRQTCVPRGRRPRDE